MSIGGMRRGNPGLFSSYIEPQPMPSGPPASQTPEAFAPGGYYNQTGQYPIPGAPPATGGMVRPLPPAPPQLRDARPLPQPVFDFPQWSTTWPETRRTGGPYIPGDLDPRFLGPWHGDGPDFFGPNAPGYGKNPPGMLPNHPDSFENQAYRAYLDRMRQYNPYAPGSQQAGDWYAGIVGMGPQERATLPAPMQGQPMPRFNPGSAFGNHRRTMGSNTLSGLAQRLLQQVNQPAQQRAPSWRVGPY